jgi:hypothetical protein
LSAIEVKRADNIQIVCRAADNAVHAYLNGEEVYAKQGIAEANFIDERRITEMLHDGYNVLTILGVKWGTRYLFDVKVEVNGNVVASHVEQQPPAGSNPMGIVWDFSVEFDMSAR